MDTGNCRQPYNPEILFWCNSTSFSASCFWTVFLWEQEMTVQCIVYKLMETKLIILYSMAEVDYIAHALPARGNRFARTISGSYQNLFLLDQQDHALILRKWIFLFDFVESNSMQNHKALPLLFFTCYCGKSAWKVDKVFAPCRFVLLFTTQLIDHQCEMKEVWIISVNLTMRCFPTFVIRPYNAASRK